MSIFGVIATYLGSFFLGVILGIATMCLFIVTHDNNDDNEVNNNGKEENI